ncbi:MAG: DUF4362 domain-containing protein [Acidobacteria bacterium]|nr:DUF4362 domain-containing protein [Acidobacteriota bacterium]
MKSLLLLISFLVLVQYIWPQRTPEPLSHEEQRLVAELRTDQAYLQVSCRGRRTVASADKDASYRLNALEAFAGGNKRSKLKKACITKEGDPILSYLTVDNGKASIVIDTSQDEFGPKRVYSYQCGELAIGIYFRDLKSGRLVFQKTAKIEGGQATLQCIAGPKEIFF